MALTSLGREDKEWEKERREREVEGE